MAPKEPSSSIVDPTGATMRATGGYPALREVARGYLHEDFELEHGNANAAACAFLAVASVTERAAVTREAKRLAKQCSGLELAQARDLVAAELGCAWQPVSLGELRRVLKTLATV
jgi:hypothetical protein